MLKNEKLDLVHSNVIGPTLLASLSNMLYFITSIDKYSRNVWTYILQNKSDVFTTFKALKVCIKTRVDIMCCFWSNNGEECNTR